MDEVQFDVHAAHEERHWWFTGRRIVLRTLVKELVPQDPDSVLVEVGCGTGANVADFAGDYRAVGVDISDVAIRLAKRRFPHMEFACVATPEDERSRIADARMILLLDVMEHVPDDFDLLSRILATARPEAYVLLTVPANEYLWSPHDVSLGHYRRYSPERLMRTWEGLPVEPLLLSPFNSKLYPIVRGIRTMTKLLRRSSGHSRTDLWMPPAVVNRWLHRRFASEAEPLRKAMVHREETNFRRGVSLIAVLRRGEGTIEPRTRPVDVQRDLHVPEYAVAETPEREAALAATSGERE